MKKILVPTDFSDHANKALDFAIDVANHFGGQITLLHTYKVYSSTGTFVSVGNYMEEDAAVQMLELVKTKEAKLKRGGTLHSKIVRTDSIARFIAKMADESDFDLIVMGTQGATGLKEIFIGSITNGVIKKTKTPILAIPKDCPYRPFKSIVFAVDQKGVSSHIVTLPLVKLAKRYKAKIQIYHLDTSDDSKGIDTTFDMFLEGVEHSFHYELNGQNITDCINQFVEDYKAELLCLVRRKRGPLEEIFHDSITSQEAFHSEVPLLVLHDV